MYRSDCKHHYGYIHDIQANEWFVKCRLADMCNTTNTAEFCQVKCVCKNNKESEWNTVRNEEG